MTKNAMLAAAVFALMSGLATADVADSGANGFTLKATFNVQAPAADVYRAVIHVGDWWNSAHTFSGNSHNLSIEEKPMGCFCEKLPNGGAVRHMQVVFFAPGQRLVMTGGLGPLQSMAATGSMTIQLSPVDGGTKLDVTYAITGYMAGGMNTLAAPVNAVLTEQFTRLKSLIEKGDPAPK